MSAPAAEDQRARDLTSQVAELAATKHHHLAADMVSGRRLLTIPAALMTLQHLNRCPDLAPAEPVITAREEPSDMPPSPPPPLRAFADVPAGYYATERPDEPGNIDFWKVEEGTKQWRGTMFVRRALGGPEAGNGRLRTVRIENMQQRLAFQAIVATGLEESQALFAGSIDRCIDCSIPLTNQESRDRHRGPDCYANFLKRS